MEESGPRCNKLQFDNGQLLDVPSNTLQIEKSSALLPPDEAHHPPQPLLGVILRPAQEPESKEEDPDDEESDNEHGDPKAEEGEGDESPEGGEEQGKEEGEEEQGKENGAQLVHPGEVLPVNYHQLLAKAQ